MLINFLTKNIFLLKLFIFMFVVINSVNFLFSCYEDMDKANQASKRFLSKFPYNDNIVTLFSRDGELASGILISPSYVLTASHTTMLRSNVDKYVATGKLESVFVDRRLHWEQTVKRTQYKSQFEIIDFGKFIPHTTIVVDIFSAKHPIDDAMEFEFLDWFTPDRIFASREIIIDSKNYKLEGYDIALLKLETPFVHINTFPKFNTKKPDTKTDETVHCVGHAIVIKNYKGDEHLKTGQQITPGLAICETPTRVVNQQVKFTEQANGKYYSTQYAFGGEDEKFIPRSEDPLNGLFISGMSGGGVFFKKGNDYTLGGIISQSYAADVVNTISNLKEFYKNNTESALYKSLLEQEQKFNSMELPVYNVHTALTPQLMKKIKNKMAK